MNSFGTSNKFAVLQQVHQPQPKPIKLIKSIPGPVPNAPHLTEQEKEKEKEKEKQLNVSENRGSSHRVRGENRGRGGNRGGTTRGGRGGRGNFVDIRTVDKLRDPDQPPKRNKRIYDRNSTVPKNDIKKAGAGTGNWGTDKDEPVGAEDAKKELETETSEVKVEEQPVAVEEKEPEDKTITLKQYQEQLAALAPKIEAPKRREANEGEKSDLDKYVVLKKSDEEEEKVVIKAKKDKAKKQPKKQTVPLSDILNVKDSGDDRRARKPYNNNNYNKKPKKVNIPIEDTDSFPALK